MSKFHPKYQNMYLRNETSKGNDTYPAYHVIPWMQIWVARIPLIIYGYIFGWGILITFGADRPHIDHIWMASLGNSSFSRGTFSTLRRISPPGNQPRVMRNSWFLGHPRAYHESKTSFRILLNRAFKWAMSEQNPLRFGGDRAQNPRRKAPFCHNRFPDCCWKQ